MTTLGLRQVQCGPQAPLPGLLIWLLEAWWPWKRAGWGGEHGGGGGCWVWPLHTAGVMAMGSRVPLPDQVPGGMRDARMPCQALGFTAALTPAQRISQPLPPQGSCTARASATPRAFLPAASPPPAPRGHHGEGAPGQALPSPGSPRGGELLPLA